MNLYIINTNLKTDSRYETEMLKEQKCAAYRSTKTEIEHLQVGDRILLYSNQKGIIAKGIASGQLHKKEDNGELEAEYYMYLHEFREFLLPISSSRLRHILTLADNKEARPFNKTSLKFKNEVSTIIWDEISKHP